MLKLNKTKQKKNKSGEKAANALVTLHHTMKIAFFLLLILMTLFKDFLKKSHVFFSSTKRKYTQRLFLLR